MNDIYYDTKTLKESLTKELDRITAIYKAWENVTFPTKKDGKPFNILSKNIEGAKLEKHSYSLIPGTYEITVYTHCESKGYINDNFSCYEVAKYIKKDDPRQEKKQNFFKIPPFEEIYNYDLDDIKEKIKTRIAYYKGQAADIKKQIAAADKAYNTFKTEYEKLMLKLQKMTVFENGNTELKYKILKSIQR